MASAATRALLARLGTRLPLIQAPMAGAQGHALAAAVARAGGLGSLPAAMLTPEGLAAELRAFAQALGTPPGDPGTPPGGHGATPAAAAGAARRAALLPVNVNFFCHTPPAPDAAEEAAWRATLAPHAARWGVDLSQTPPGAGRQPFSAAMAEVLETWRPQVLSFHFGLPEPALLARVKAWGACVLSSATTVDEARWLQAQGADAVIAQGLEAGGHRGHFLDGDDPARLCTRPVAELARQTGLFALLPRTVAAVQLPVIAAGGIADAAGVRAALALGAAAVQVGTAFLLCPEAGTGALHRRALASARAGDTVLTNLFSGRPARGIVNGAIRALGALHPAAPRFPLATAAIAPLRAAAEAAGSDDFTPLWAGQNTAGCRAVPAAEVVAALAAGFAGEVADAAGADGAAGTAGAAGAGQGTA